MRIHPLQSAFSVLGSAGLGAALMYLFDPETGSNRRDTLADTGKQALSSTGDALQSTYGAAKDQAGHSAKSIAGKIHDYAQHLAEELSSRTASVISTGSDQAHSALDTAKSSASSATDSLSDLRDRLTDHANTLLSRGRKAAKEQIEPSHPYATATGVTAGTIGVLAVGAGLMYFMDPQRGRARRAWARDKAFSVTRRTGKQARSYGTHLGNRLKGVSHSAQQLVESVPETIGAATSHTE